MRGLLIVFSLIAIEAQTIATMPGSMDGRVSNSMTGELIPGATLHLLPLRFTGDRSSPLQTTSQPDGGFRFDSVPPGNYIVLAERDGFIPTQPDSQSRLISVQAGQTLTGITVQMAPEGSITGNVVDEDGNPIAGVEIRALPTHKQDSPARGASAKTDDAGGFKLPKLTPGDYYLLASPPEKAPGDFVRTIYPRSLSFDDAGSVQVAGGQTVSDISIRLRKSPTYHIRGKVPEPPDGAQLQKFRISVTPRVSASVSLDAATLAKSVRINPDRSFEIGGLLPGSYTLRFTGQLLPSDRPHRLLSRLDVEIGTSNLEDVVLQIIPPLTLAGHVSAETQSAVNLTRVRLLAVPTEDTARATQVSANVAADGSFSLTNLDPATYQIRVVSVVPGTYVKSISLNQQDIMNKPVDFSETGSGALDIVLRPGTGEVDGTVQPADSPAMVILVPETIGPDGWSGVEFGYTRQGAGFSVVDLAPGKYTAYAADRLAPNLWQNAQFLRDISNLGTSVNVDENGRQQIQLQKVPVEELQQVAARLGLAVQ